MSDPQLACRALQPSMLVIVDHGDFPLCAPGRDKLSAWQDGIHRHSHGSQEGSSQGPPVGNRFYVQLLPSYGLYAEPVILD